MSSRRRLVRLATLLLILAPTATINSQGAAPDGPCARMLTVTLPNGKVALAEAMARGEFVPEGVPPQLPQPKALLAALPAFCRVAATLSPTSDSEIGMEVWLPAAGWNGKLQGVGNGGWGGRLATLEMLAPLAQGYATASSDTGHSTPGAGFVIGHPERLVDYSSRAAHEMTVAAKAIVAAYYGRPARLSYWSGCSLGGQQGLKQAQAYPADYDGIVAGSPTYNRTRLHAWQLQMGHRALTETRTIPLPKLTLLNEAVLEACDSADAVRDGILSDPRQCRFDPATLRCLSGDSAECLTDGQVQTARQMYASLADGRGRPFHHGAAPGSELGWAGIVGGPQPFALATGLFGFIVHQDEQWDWRTFDFDRDAQLADERYATVLNADNPDLRAFRARGGKLLLMHGWADALVPPQGTIDYYDRVVRASGGNDFVRLFLEPGVDHCSGGVGPDQVNAIAGLERWRESGRPPDSLLAARIRDNRVDMTRPLCPYPQFATYTGTGSTTDAGNFRCKALP